MKYQGSDKKKKGLNGIGEKFPIFIFLSLQIREHQN